MLIKNKLVSYDRVHVILVRQNYGYSSKKKKMADWFNL